ncbi:serine kinase [candidate division KSB1 bacterium]|nr:serine kinase [candidate division KSB1 bacterium]
MKLEELCEKLQLRVITDQPDLDKEVTFACCSDILSDVMTKSCKGCLWITNLAHENVLAISFFRELAGVILAGGLVPQQEVVDKANEKNLLLLSTPLSAFEICGRLYQMGIRG